LWKKSKLRLAAAILAGALALGALMVAVLHTPPVRRFALKQLVQILGKQGIDFDASAVSYNLLDLTATLDDVTVRSRLTPDLPPIARAGRVQVDLSLRKLLSGAFYVEDAQLVKPALNLVIDEQGRDNIPHPPTKESSSETDYLIQKFRATGGSLEIDDRRQQIHAVIPRWQLSIDGNPVTMEHDIRLQTLEAGTIAFQQRSLPIRGLTAEVLLQKNAVDVRSVQLTLRESTVTLAGKLDNLKDPRYDFKAETNLALGSLAQFAGVQQRVSGTVHASLTATGRPAQLVATARLDGKDLTIDRFDKLNLQAETAYEAAAQRVQLKSLNVFSPTGTIQGKGSVALNTKVGDSTLNAAVRGVDMARLSTTLKLPVQIASRATGDVAAHWPGLAFEQIAGDATLRLAETRPTPAKDVIPVSGVINAKSAGNRVVVGLSSVHALNTQATGQITLVNQQTLAGDVHLDAPDLTALVAGAEAFLGRAPGTLVGTSVGGALQAQAKLGGTLQNPAASVTLDSTGVQAGTLSGITVHAAADYNPSRVAIQTATVEWQHQQLTASGNIGLAGKAPALELQARTTDLSIPTILAAAGHADIQPAGTLRLDATISGTTQDPRGQVNIAGSNLEAYNEKLGTLTAKADASNQTLTVTQLLLDKPQPNGNGALEAIGSYNLQSKDYSANLISRNLRLISLTLPDGSPVRATLDFKANGQGNVDNPAATVSLAAGDVQYRDQQYGSVNLTANVANQQAAIEAVAPGFNLNAKANAGIKDPNPATFEITANNTDLAKLPVKLDMPVTGTVSATIRGSGDIQHYQQGQASAEISKLDITYNNQPIRTEGPLVASYQNQMLTIERATILARESRISVDGKLPLEASAGQGAINVSSTLNLQSLLNYIQLEQRVVAQGTATINGTITGTLKSIDPNLNITLNDGFLSGESIDPPIANIAVKAQIKNGALELESASGELGPATFQASGQIPFGLLPADLPVTLPRRQGPAQFTAEVKELDIASFGAVPQNVRGAVSVKVEAEAPRPEMEAVTAKITFPVLKLGVGAYDLQQKGTAAILVSNGTARFEQFGLTGPQTDIQFGGTVGLAGAQPLDLKMDGTLDASIASAFTEAVRTRGATEAHVAVTGTIKDPQAQGYVQLADAQVSMQNPRVGLDNLNARIDLAGSRITLSRLDGMLNGGTLSGGGTLEYANGRFQNTSVKLKGDGVYLDFPKGLKTVSIINLDVHSTAEHLIIGGNVLIEDGGFTDDLNLDSGILAAITAPRGIDLTEERNPTLENIQFDLGIKTENPILVKNNLAKAEITADLRVLGNPYQTGLSGRLTIEEGGQITLNERKYTIDRGNVLFTNDRRIEPNLDVLAKTTAAGYDITLQVSGPPGKTETTLTSDPPLPEQDILAVLLTGKTLDQVRGQEFEVARNQVLSYLTGRVGSSLGRGISGATGLSMVRIEPNLIANETDPSARLTVGQDITPKLNLVYSMDLINSSDQIYVAEYDITRRFSTRAVRQSDGSYRLDFRHDLRFGGIPEPKAVHPENRIVQNISILGNTYFTDLQIKNKLGVKEGKKYDFFKVRRGVDRVDQMYAKENRLEANVRLKRDIKDGALDLTVNVQAGPVVNIVYEGADVKGSVRKRIREIWQSGVFDTQRVEESIDALRGWLISEQHLQPKIEYKIATPQPDQKSVVFDIQPGPRFGKVDLVFDGASGVEPAALQKIVKDQKLTTDVYLKPGRVTELLSKYYQEQGYLDAKIENPKYELNAQQGAGKVVFPVMEGPLYRIANVEFKGNSAISTAKLAEAVPLPKGEAYRPVLRERSQQKIQELYWEQGFNDMESTISTRRSKEAGTLDALINITENSQSVVREIAVEGNKNTSEKLVRSQLEVKPGDILNLQKLSASRRNLYHTGAYSIVEITRVEISPEATGQSADQRQPQSATGRPPQKPVRLVVKVRELQPFQIRYGGYYDTERGPGGIFEVTNRNSLGSARTLGLSTRYDSQLQEVRLYFTQPLLLRFPVSTTASPFIRREQNPAVVSSDPAKSSDAFNVDRIAFSVQQQAKFQNKYVLNYGYRIEKSRTYDPGPDPFLDITLRIASLTASLTHETRDDVLDATRGDFYSHAFQYSPQLLGSQVQFVKYFGQYFRYFPLQKPKVELFTNKVLRPRLVYATGVRVGMAKGLSGQEVPLSERFVAGGSTTIRGFQQNSIGPIIGGSNSIAGDALLVINNEIRYPLIKYLDGVGFVDVGNVYAHISDFSITDIRKAAGLGLRVRTPWFLLRLDYGIKLDRKSGESLGRFFFSIGQAF
jgi:outer membrane protein assembly complex protein YaeT